MKTKIYIGLLSLLSVNVFAQDKQEKTIEPFSSLSTSGAVNVKYRNSDTNQVILKGSEEDFGKIEFYIKENTLFINSKGNIQDPLTVYVSGNKLNEVYTSGASSVRSSEIINAPNFILNATGASNIHLGVKSDSVNATASGASEINLKGSTTNFNAVVTGAAGLKAYELISENSDINASGASNARVFASQKITVNATGASNVKFKGEPKTISAEGS
jgi:hypothetical protein